MFEGAIALCAKDIAILTAIVVIAIEKIKLIPYVGQYVHGKVTRYVAVLVGYGLAWLFSVISPGSEGFIWVTLVGVGAGLSASGGTDWLRKLFEM